MNSPEHGKVLIDRFWLPFGETYRTDSRGWLVDPAPGRTDTRLLTSALTDLECLVLLGEPGIGKSTALDQLAPLPAKLYPSLRVNLAAYSSESRLVTHLFEGTEISRWSHSGERLTLTLDSFDEAHDSIPNLHVLLAEYLEGWDRKRLSLRIACRTAEWPSSLTEKLERMFDHVNLVELLPLRRVDAAAIVRDLPDPELFLELVENARAVPLAARPLTLRLLRRTYERDGALPSRSSELYERGLLNLVDEVNQSRRDTKQQTRDPFLLLACAGWIAAASAFGSKPHVWIGPESMAPSEDLVIHELISETQPRSMIEAVVRTGVFTGAGVSRIGWAHATFQDFLAARWLANQTLAEQQTRSILLTEDDRVHPRLRRVAAWLVAIAPNRFEWIVTQDPEAFLLNVDLPDPELRAVVVEGLLEEARKGELYHDYARDLSGLTHDKLASQLSSALKEGSADLLRLALEIAGQSKVTSLSPELVRIALDQSADPQNRVSAVLVAHGLLGDGIGDSLVPLFRQIPGKEKVPAEIEAAALIASWPHSFTTQDVFKVLDPRGPRNFYGLYNSFLNSLASGITPDDVPHVSDWFKAEEARLNDPRLEDLMTAALSHAVKSLSSRTSRDLVRNYAVAKAAQLEALLPKIIFDKLEPNMRRSIALLILEDADDDTVFGVVNSMGTGERPLLQEGDFDWTLAACDAAAGSMRVKLASAVRYLYSPSNASQSNAVLALHGDHPAAIVLSFWRTSVRLDSAEAAQGRIHTNKMRQLRRRRKPATVDDWVNPKIDGLSVKARNGDLDAFWQAVRLVTVRPGTTMYHGEHQPDLTRHPRWDTLSIETTSNLVISADAYVRGGRCEPDEWVGKGLNWFRAEAGYRALILLLRKQPDVLQALPGEVWREWSPILVAWSTGLNAGDLDDKRLILALARPHAYAQLTITLLRLVDEAVLAGKAIFRREEFQILASPSLAVDLVARLENPDISDGMRNCLLDALSGTTVEVRNVLLKWLAPAERSGNSARALDAVVWLLSFDAAENWSTLTELMQTDVEFMKSAALSFAESRPLSPPELAEGRLAELYIWLARNFPILDDPSFDEVHIVGSRESVGRWRDSILDQLTRSGTPSSIEAIYLIMESLPDTPWLGRALAIAREARRDASWQPLAPQELARLTADQSTRLLRTTRDVNFAILQALSEIQVQLQGDTPSSFLLWDTHSKRPKTEDQVSDFLRNEIGARTARFGIVTNREVQVRRSENSGLPERTDLRFDCVNGGHPGGLPSAVPAEVKGSWNRESVRSIESQLLNRYMADFGSNFGIYLAVWFDLESWTDDTDSRRRQAKTWGDQRKFRLALEHEAARLSTHGRHITVVVLDASLRRPDGNR